MNDTDILQVYAVLHTTWQLPYLKCTFRPAIEALCLARTVWVWLKNKKGFLHGAMVRVRYSCCAVSLLLVQYDSTVNSNRCRCTYIYISDPHSRGTNGVFYTCFYNHARLSRSSNGLLKPILDPGGGFTSETATYRFQK